MRAIISDELTANIYPDRSSMGTAAAAFVAGHLQRLLSQKNEVRIVVGSAPSQDEFFAFLTSSPLVDLIDWGRVVVFHMDEYVGLQADHPQSFRMYQKKHLLSKVDVRAFHAIRGEADDVESECRRLTDLLTEQPIDLVCLG
ncbi:MAG: 6-phosphogluconolactonase, partial [Candidatus Latescibacterota bacterium]